MTAGPIVINAGPLVALSMVGQLDMLAVLYGQVLVPACLVVLAAPQQQGALLPGCPMFGLSIERGGRA